MIDCSACKKQYLLSESELNNSHEWQTIIPGGGNLDESLNERHIFDDDNEYTTLSEFELLQSHVLSVSPSSSYYSKERDSL